LKSLQNKELVLELHNKPPVNVTFLEAVEELLKADQDQNYDEEVKDAWAKLGFEDFLQLYKLAIP